MPIHLVEVENQTQLEEFIKFPNRLYNKNPYYVPPLYRDEQNLLGKKNPARSFVRTRYFLAKSNAGETLGRIACMINKKENETAGKDKMRFGWLDFSDDLPVSEKLLSAAIKWAETEKIDYIEGPVGFTNLDKAGMLTGGFDELSNMVTWYNAAYYPRHLLQHGWAEHRRWIEYEFDVPAEIPSRLLRLRDSIMKRYGLEILDLQSRADLRQMVPEIFELLTAAYRKLPSFVPLTEAQKSFYARQFLEVIPPEFVCCVVDKDKNLVGFAITMPSLVRALQRSGGKLFPFGWWHIWRALKTTKRAELLLIGVHPEWQNKGVVGLIFPYIMQTFMQRGIQKVESNPEFDDNQQVQALWKQYDGRKHKHRATFVKYLP